MRLRGDLKGYCIDKARENATKKVQRRTFLGFQLPAVDYGPKILNEKF